ncbi:MAG: RNA-binding transcriptional accessory protein [Chlorobi bacterium]|nr:RNA-binding transcriptional accessory protein [Chlorobiota bacterium]
MIPKKYIFLLSAKLNLNNRQIENTVKLLAEGSSIPFISRYRKEMTGSLDEIQVQNIKEEYQKFIELEKRKETVINTIKGLEKLTPELEKQIEILTDINELEDIYLPFKPKKKTKATVAKKIGLEPLAKIIFAQNSIDIETKAEEFLNENVRTTKDALQGARDIIAEWISENKLARSRVRILFEKEAIISTKIIKGKEEEGIKYRDYFNSSELLRQCSSHRLLAILRGEKESFLRVNIEPGEEKAIIILNKIFIKGNNEASEQVEIAIKDSYNRLLKSALENEIKKSAKEKADEEAIEVFAKNLRQLLLASPLGQKRVLAIDPGFRTGCKVVCLNEQGDLLHNETIFPHPPKLDIKTASHKISSLANAYQIEAIAIGNGTAGRETESFIRNKVLFKNEVKVFIVNESGASIYSASAIAREEFPEYDVTVRGAVSIGRRLIDPLAELVKIDPKSIGVGQYQHDVNQKKLKESLQQVVENCVNLVGVNLNTASKYLLTFVSGLGSTIAENIIRFRNENGPFTSRKQLKNIPRMGEKAFEQCAGFLRIPNAENPLDNSAVHPESYYIVKKMAKDQKCSITDLLTNETKRSAISIENYTNENVGIPTLKDIMAELAKPGRDPRTKISAFEFDQSIHSIQDLRIGMTVPGIVTNLTKFGAFVDIGVKQDGLVHISQIKEAFVKDPADILSLNQHVEVKILEVDIIRKRIQLSMIGIEQPKYVQNL